MATGTISPSPYGQEIDANGDPIAGALIYTYLAGTSTAATTWTTVNVSGGSAVPNSNPIVADSAGRWVAFLQNGVSYKYVFCLPVSPIPPPSSPPSAYKTVDNIEVPGDNAAVDISGVLGESVIAPNLLYLSDGSGAKTAGKWYIASSTNTFSSTTPELGFAVIDGSANDTIFIRQAGRMTGMSGLTPGALYYASTSGAITVTAPANARFVGQSDTTTTLVASPNPPVAIGVKIVNLTDTATPALDASLGSEFSLVATGNRTIAVPTNGTLGQKIVIAHYASGGIRTLSLNTAANGFRFGSDITGLTATASGKVDYIGCIRSLDYGGGSFWDVVAYVKGY